VSTQPAEGPLASSTGAAEPHGLARIASRSWSAELRITSLISSVVRGILERALDDRAGPCPRPGSRSRRGRARTSTCRQQGPCHDQLVHHRLELGAVLVERVAHIGGVRRRSRMTSMTSSSTATVIGRLMAATIGAEKWSIRKTVTASPTTLSPVSIARVVRARQRIDDQRNVVPCRPTASASGTRASSLPPGGGPVARRCRRTGRAGIRSRRAKRARDRQVDAVEPCGARPRRVRAPEAEPERERAMRPPDDSAITQSSRLTLRSSWAACLGLGRKRVHRRIEDLNENRCGRACTGWRHRRAHPGRIGDVPLYRAEAVVLRTHKLGEADRIITLLTRDHGRVRAVAKGVRRTTSGGEAGWSRSATSTCSSPRGATST
jgi:hypothetical protein